MQGVINRITRRALCISLAALSLSCTTFAPNERGPETAPVAAEFTLYEGEAPLPELWWETLGSEELNALIDRALSGNLTLQQVSARLTQAEMLARQAGAARMPALNATGDMSISRQRVDTGASTSKLDIASQKLGAATTLSGLPSSIAAGTGSTATNVLNGAQSGLQAAETLFAGTPSSATTSTTHSYRFGLGSSYEVDLWGRVKAQHEATLLDFEASREDLRTSMLSLSGTVALQWLTIVEQTQELALVNRQLELNKTTLELIELRVRKGQATALDFYQQRQIVAQTESLLPPLESELQSARHELAVLLGELPRADIPVSTETLPQVGAIPDPGLPADLLARRPDVRARGLLLQAADWRVSAARANRLPSLALTASATYGANEWELVFDNWIATLAGSLTGPIFDAGRRKAEVERTRAVVDERLAAYRETVLDAIKEVENGLLQETKQAEYIEALNRELEAAELAHEQALARYLKGLNDYLPVLSALSGLQVLERQLLRAELSRLNLRVQTCIALGGTWMESQDQKTEP